MCDVFLHMELTYLIITCHLELFLLYPLSCCDSLLLLGQLAFEILKICVHSHSLEDISSLTSWIYFRYNAKTLSLLSGLGPSVIFVSSFIAISCDVLFHYRADEMT